MSIQRCKFCDHESDDTICGYCQKLHETGYSARARMLPMEDCPWERCARTGRLAELETVELRGVLRLPGIHFFRSCPWCAGWSQMERELFEGAAR
ncbi:MAG: hypothetical protein BWX64_01586 [Acidobacteria bacterium ADurb.Bin051]|nr:MAG: hypothetical protein BWX64_01586 [Acidobacteria bacterium ADurb.Bin051]